MIATDRRILDCHTHLPSIGEADGLEVYMDTAGIAAINVLALVNPMPPWWARPGSRLYRRPLEPKDANNLACLALKARHPDKVFVFGGLNHYSPEVLSGRHNYAEQAQNLINMGVDGFKMWEGGLSLREGTGLPLDAAEYDEYYSLVESASLPILYHVNEPYRHEVDGLLTKHSDLRVILAHFYGGAGELDRLGRFLDAWPSTYVDLAPGLMYRGLAETREESREFFISYQDRIVFGTDAQGSDPQWGAKLVGLICRFLERDDDLALHEIGMDGLQEPSPSLSEGARLFRRELYVDRGLCLGNEVLENIYSANFERLVGKKPRKLDFGASLEACEALLGRVRKGLDTGRSAGRAISRRRGGTDYTINLAPYTAAQVEEIEQCAGVFRDTR